MADVVMIERVQGGMKHHVPAVPTPFTRQRAAEIWAERHKRCCSVDAVMTDGELAYVTQVARDRLEAGATTLDAFTCIMDGRITPPVHVDPTMQQIVLTVRMATLLDNSQSMDRVMLDLDLETARRVHGKQFENFEGALFVLEVSKGNGRQALQALGITFATIINGKTGSKEQVTL